MQRIVFTVFFLYLSSPFIAYSTESVQSSTPYTSSQGPRNAPITVIQYSDFQCKFCAKVVPVIKQIQESYPGQVRWIFKNYPLPSHQDAFLAHEAALAAGAQGKFWEMHDVIFDNQTKIKRAHLLEYAKQLNLDIDKFHSALDSGMYKEVIEDDIEEGKALGVRGPPTFIINGKKLEGLRSFVAFKTLIDKALLFASSFERMSGEKLLSKEQVAVNIASSPLRGEPDAPITIIEFSDFQSPSCAKSAKVINNITEKYDGKIKWLYKYYPQDIKPVHEAVFAAEEQRKFWKMHDLIFSNQVAIDDLDHILYASQLGLDMDRFMTVLNSRRHKAKIKQDKALGELLGVKEVPTLFVNGRKLVGSQSTAAIETVVEEELDRLAHIKDTLKNARKHSPNMTRIGPSDAPVQIMVFSDFQSPHSAQVAWLLKILLMEYPKQIVLQFKNYPLVFNPEDGLAHVAAIAAGEQGKFWEMHDMIFSIPEKQDKTQLIKYAKILNLDLVPFKNALESKAYQSLLQKDMEHGKLLGVNNVSTLFINSTRVDGTPSIASLKSLIETELKQEGLCRG